MVILPILVAEIQPISDFIACGGVDFHPSFSITNTTRLWKEYTASQS
jgi:hypothetical protein